MDASTATAAPPGRVEPGRRDVAALLALGALAGLTWASSLRAYMVELAGPASRVTWTGTFAGILLPGAVVGALLGWAGHLRRTGGRRGWRWLPLSPLLFPVAALSLPGAVTTLLRTGQGGGAVGIALLAVLGGSALSGRGPRWSRAARGVVAFSVVPAAYLGPPLRPELDPVTPLGAWVATTSSTLFVTLALACALPLRPVTGPHRREPAEARTPAPPARRPACATTTRRSRAARPPW